MQSIDYFDDLRVVAAFHRVFPCGICHKKMHCRQGFYSLELISRGEVDLILDSSLIHLKAPVIFWIGDHNHSFEFRFADKQSYEHIWVDFSGTRGKRIYESVCSAYPLQFMPLPQDHNLTQFFDAIALDFEEVKKPDSSPKWTLQLEHLMYEIWKMAKKNEQFKQADKHGIISIGERIRQNPFDSYDIKELAAETNLSCVHFRSLFKDNFGMSIWQYILAQKMETAGELLKTGNFRIGELAEYCGFNDVTIFSRAFKRHFSKSPHHFLNANENSFTPPDYR